MIPVIPRAAHLATCTSEAALLRMTAQGALPLLIVYHQSRLPVRLPRWVVLGVLLRLLMAAELLDGLQKRCRIVGQPPPALGTLLQLRSIDLTPKPWTGQGRAVS